MTKRLTIKCIAVLCLAVIAATLFPAGRTYADDAAPADWLTGVWQGMARNSKGTQYALTLTVDPAKPGKAVLRFSPPALCSIYLANAKQDGNAVSFTFNDSTGGMCDRYYGGTFQVKQEAGSLVLTLSTAKSDRMQARMRKRVNAAAKELKAAEPKKDKTE